MAQLIADKGQQVSDAIPSVVISVAPVLAGFASEAVSNAVTWAMFTTGAARLTSGQDRRRASR
jgi:hypothetical protein